MNVSESWLCGLLWADGGIMWKNKRSLCVVLNTTDRELAEQASEIMGGKHIGFREARPPRKAVYTLAVYGEWPERLFDLGLSPRKSLTCEFPNIPHRSHFLRGYFDGDGSIWRDAKYRHLESSIVGSTPFLSRAQDVLVDEAGVCRNKIHPHGSIARLMFNTADTLRLGSYLYQDGGPCLTRKKILFPEMMRHA